MALTDLTRISTSGIATGSTIDAPILRKDVNFHGSQVGVVSALFDSSDDALEFGDNVKLRFGASNDLTLFHNASDSVITHSAAGEGNLKILSGGAQSIECEKAGAVNITHNGSTKIETTSHGAVITGVLTATSFSGGISGDTIGNVYAASGISTFYDLRVSNNLTVEGTTTTLDTNLIGVDRVEVGANSNTVVGVAITQSGSADILNLFNASGEQVTVLSSGNVGLGSAVPELDLDVTRVASGDNVVKVENRASALSLIKYPNVNNADVKAGSDYGNFAVYTGGDSGSRKLRVEHGGNVLIENGNVGIGTVNPDRMLHILGTGNAIVKMEANYSGSVTGIEGVLTASGANRYVTGVYGKVVNTSGSESNVASIRLWNEQASPTTSDSPGYITFNTTNDGANAATEKLRIESNGNILAKTGTQFKGFHLVKEDGGTVAQLVGHGSDNDEGGVNLWDGGTKKVQILSNGSSYLNGGRIGIGTINPSSYKLEVWDDTSATFMIRRGDASRIILSNDSQHNTLYSQTISGYAARQFAVRMGQSEAIRIGVNGGVGIGTDYLSGNNSVYHKLMVEGDTTSQIAVAKILRRNSSASNSTYTFEIDSSAHTSNMANAGAMSVDVYGGRAFTIDGNGKVGINTVSMTKRLQMDTTGNSGEGILLKSTDSTYPAFMGDANRDNYDLFLVAFQGYWNGNRVGEVTVEAGSDTGNKDEGMVKIRTRNDGDSSPQDRLTVYHTGQTEIHSTTDSSSSTTGALRVNGGIGVAKSVVADGFISNGGALSHRNVVINGGMEIAQRGTTSTGNTSGGYKTCDGWELSLNSAGTWTVTRSGTCPDGFKHSIKLDCTTANTSLSSTSFLSVRQNFEGQDLQRFAKGTSGAKAITVSFYVKTNKNGTYAVELYDTDNTKIATSLYTVSDNNWNRYEFTIPASTNTGQFDNDNGKSMNLGFIVAAGTNYTNGTQYGSFVQGSNLNRAAGLTVNLADSTSNEFYLTGVQMEEGSVATPFEHKSFTEELTRCYRYYRRFGANGSLPTPAPYNRFSIGYSPSSSDVRFPFQLDPPMRINPTNSNFSKSGSFSIQPGSIGSYSLTCDNNSCSPSMLIAIMGSTSVSSGAGSAVSLHANNDTSAYIEISAEL